MIHHGDEHSTTITHPMLSHACVMKTIGEAGNEVGTTVAGGLRAVGYLMISQANHGQLEAQEEERIKKNRVPFLDPHSGSPSSMGVVR